MRKLLLMALPFVVLAGGCQMFEGKSHTGCGLWIYHPPTIDTQMPVLVNAPQTTGTAHPMGSASGPVSEGTFTHAPTVPVPPMTMPRGTSQVYGCDPGCPPLGPPRLTIQEWADCAKTINTAPLPAAPSRNTQ